MVVLSFGFPAKAAFANSQLTNFAAIPRYCEIYAIFLAAQGVTRNVNGNVVRHLGPSRSNQIFARLYHESVIL
jgi:hypothetical protein